MALVDNSLNPFLNQLALNRLFTKQEGKYSLESLLGLEQHVLIPEEKDRDVLVLGFVNPIAMKSTPLLNLVFD